MTLPWVAEVAQVCLAALGFAAVLCMVRIIRGPTMADRVAALELIALTIVASGAVFAVAGTNALWLDVSIVVVIVGFLGTVAVSQYLLSR